MEAWLNTISMRMQRIIRYRIFEELPWAEVAARMGRKATPDGIRKEYENFMKSLLDFNKEIDENIKSFCSRCKYYGTKEADKCDSLIHGCSYGVDCKYIGKAKGEDMSRYENRKIMDF